MAAGVAVAFAALVLAICGVMLGKIVRIDLAIRALAANSGAIRTETETLFRQVQALLALERKLDLREALPLMRGWVGSPDFLLFMADEIVGDGPIPFSSAVRACRHWYARACSRRMDAGGW